MWYAQHRLTAFPLPRQTIRTPWPPTLQARGAKPSRAPRSARLQATPAPPCPAGRGQHSAERCAMRRTRRLYSCRLLWYSCAASGLAGEAQFGSARPAARVSQLGSVQSAGLAVTGALRRAQVTSQRGVTAVGDEVDITGERRLLIRGQKVCGARPGRDAARARGPHDRAAQLRMSAHGQPRQRVGAGRGRRAGSAPVSRLWMDVRIVHTLWHGDHWSWMMSLPPHSRPSRRWPLCHSLRGKRPSARL